MMHLYRAQAVGKGLQGVGGACETVLDVPFPEPGFVTIEGDHGLLLEGHDVYGGVGRPGAVAQLSNGNLVAKGHIVVPSGIQAVKPFENEFEMRVFLVEKSAGGVSIRGDHHRP